ncbi:MAG: 3-keto-disaccharide hydrolase [Planctomycetia bacterium]
MIGVKRILKTYGTWSAVGLTTALAAVVGAAEVIEYQSGIKWQEPAKIDPGPAGGPPSDAVVLFDGTSLSQWKGGENWIVADGAATAAKNGVETKEKFGDCQLHIEWASPSEVKGSGQGRGNSGVYFLGRYEVQILDNYDNKTYFDGQAGALYKQKPPMVNACRKPGEWQTYDVIFEGPRFNDSGDVTRPTVVTVLHNGVVVQNHTELTGGTDYDSAPYYKKHPPTGPIHLQFHGNPVKFRNIWLRELKEPVGKKVKEPNLQPPADAAKRAPA